MGGDAAHRVHRHRPADDLVMPPAGPIGPGDVKLDRLAERHVGDLGRDAADHGGVDPASRRDGLGRIAVVEITFGDQLKHRNRLAPVGQAEFADDRRGDVGRLRLGEGAGVLVVAQRIAIGVAREQAVLGFARRLRRPASAALA